MADPSDFDVVIAGGGIAGTAAAAALRGFGLRTLVVEPGIHEERRLSGELFHPAGVGRLAELGLLDCLSHPSTATIRGFSAFPRAGDPYCITLPYDIVSASKGSGLAASHDLIRERLRAALTDLDHVTLIQGARIVALVLDEPNRPQVTLLAEGRNWVVRCRLLIGADGGTSRIRELGGIGYSKQRLSTITGYEIIADRLPSPGFGHVFLGGTAPIMAYEMGGERVRVLFDQPASRRHVKVVEYCRLMAPVLPPPLRDAVLQAIETQRGTSVATHLTTVEETTRGALMLMGDASGTCHPLTASGMFSCISDAINLRVALGETDGDIGRALPLYARRRLALQRSRMALASALHDACSGESQELRALHAGLIRYWEKSERGRAAGLALLIGSDTRTLSLIREMVAVCMYGLTERSNTRQPHFPVTENMVLIYRISRVMMKHLGAALRAR
jgi:squalene monooxygenase